MYSQFQLIAFLRITVCDKHNLVNIYFEILLMTKQNLTQKYIYTGYIKQCFNSQIEKYTHLLQESQNLSP